MGRKKQGNARGACERELESALRAAWVLSANGDYAFSRAESEEL